jgi:hypothetical protein
MMHIRRVLTLAVAVAALAGIPVLGAPQDNEEESRRDQERRSEREQRDIQALVQMVDASAEGTQPVPADIGIQWEANHFIRGADGATYIPFTLAVDASALAAPDTAIYVRAVRKESAAPAVDESDDDSDDDPAVSEYPWDNVNFLQLAADGRLARAIALEPGDYELFIAIKEQDPLEPERNQPPAKAGLLRRDISVPNFRGADLTISSVFIGDIEPLTTPLTPEEQQDNPYTFGTMRVVPSTDFRLPKSGELQVLFWIYGAEQADGKPDMQIDYSFHQKTAEGETYFNKTAPQVLNASTLPPQFDIAAGHQLPGSIVIPLASFPEGEYRLEITLTDSVSGRTLIHNATFIVEA